MTYWVDFSCTYEYLDTDTNEWEECKECDAMRFHCLKKDIKKEVIKCVEKELEGETYRNLKVNINDSYLTTDLEL